MVTTATPVPNDRETKYQRSPITPGLIAYLIFYFLQKYANKKVPYTLVHTHIRYFTFDKKILLTYFTEYFTYQHTQSD